MEERLKSHYESLSRVISFTRTADTKAAPVLALQVALMGALATRVDKLVSIVGNSHCDAEKVALIMVLVAYVLSLIGTIWMAAAVYMPRNPKTGRSLIFFEDIAAMNYSSFETAAKDMPSDIIEQQLIDQIYRVSRVASVKMKRVSWAIWISLPTIVFGLTLLAWSSF